MTTSGPTRADWRSSLYPSDWSPGYRDSEGRFLHDFSYAGYHKGEASIPTNPPGNVYDVTSPPYNADNTGATDTTSAIQSAIDAAGEAGGGVVYLPAGTYPVKPQGKDADYALLINKSHVVLRGEGKESTFIYNDEPDMRFKNVIYVRPGGGEVIWTPDSEDEDNVVSVTSDKRETNWQLPVSSLSGFEQGDWVVVRTDATQDWIDEHRMTNKWNSGLMGVAFYRRISRVQEAEQALIIDIPLRYWMKTRDNFRVYKITPHLQEVGLEGFSIGMRENNTPGTGDEDFEIEGTGAYEMHASHAIEMNHAVDCWIKNVSSYGPSSNSRDVQILSNGIRLYYTRNVTIDQSYMAKPQYEGAGGNGYGFTIQAQENLITNSKGYHTRHNFSFTKLVTSGNVLYNCITERGRYETDFHMWLSMANLIDNMTVEFEELRATYRTSGTVVHGQTTTQSVFWNTHGLSYRDGKNSIVASQQFKWGYVIGTRGPASRVDRPVSEITDPKDFVEGEGVGDSLRPQSLYLDQLNRRTQPYYGSASFGIGLENI
jgi:hypothetical protein